jgi:asparagine synthetase B (glutamine-hydrolysing)
MAAKRISVVEQLRRSIRNCGETEYCVAKGAGVDTSVLSRFMRRRRGISLSTAAKLCNYLDLALAERLASG